VRRSYRGLQFARKLKNFGKLLCLKASMQKDLGFLQKIIRLYTFHTPLKKGRHRLAVFAKNLDGNLPKELLTSTKDGRKFIIDPAPHPYEKVYFLGEYEPEVTEIISKIVKKGDVCLDIGANIGWYTTLLQKLVGESGQVYAFEPVPKTFSLLNRNVELNSGCGNIFVNNIALGETEKEVEIYLFDKLPDGHASLVPGDNNEFQTFNVRMVTLNSFIEENNIGEIDFIKADIEGAELTMLKGAGKVFEQSRPPMLEIEMALETSRGFDYLPNDLIEFISNQRDYDFYRIIEEKNQLKKIKGFNKDDIGANVLCVPRGFYRERLNNLNIAD
jgi:FkbM family methyltransferase